MKFSVMGFLQESGIAGVLDILLFVVIGTIIGISILYMFLIYKKDPRPKKICIKLHIAKIILLSTLLYLLLHSPSIEAIVEFIIFVVIWTIVGLIGLLFYLYIKKSPRSPREFIKTHFAKMILLSTILYLIRIF